MCAITELAVCFRFSFRSEGLGISLLRVSFSGAFIVVLDLPADFPESCIWKAISEFPWGIIKRATDTKSSSSSSPWRRDADPQPSTGKSSSSSSNSWVRDEGPQPSTDNWWSSNSRWSDEDPQHALKLPQRQAPPPPKKTEVTLIPSTMHQEPSPEVPNNTIRQPRTPSHSPPRKRAKMQTPQPPPPPPPPPAPGPRFEPSTRPCSSPPEPNPKGLRPFVWTDEDVLAAQADEVGWASFCCLGFTFGVVNWRDKISSTLNLLNLQMNRIFFFSRNGYAWLTKVSINYGKRLCRRSSLGPFSLAACWTCSAVPSAQQFEKACKSTNAKRVSEGSAK